MSEITKRDYYEVLLHWEKNVVVSIDGDWWKWSKKGKDCAFCNRLRGIDGGRNCRIDEGANCQKCPIYEDTGYTDCIGTPWEKTHPSTPLSNWEEHQYLFTLALSNSMADEYYDEIDWEEEIK